LPESPGEPDYAPQVAGVWSRSRKCRRAEALQRPHESDRGAMPTTCFLPACPKADGGDALLHTSLPLALCHRYPKVSVVAQSRRVPVSRKSRLASQCIEPCGSEVKLSHPPRRTRCGEPHARSNPGESKPRRMRSVPFPEDEPQVPTDESLGSW